MNRQTDGPQKKKALRSKLQMARRILAETQHNTLSTACESETPAKSLSILGPYPDRDKWRLVTVEDGHRSSMVLETREESEEVKARLLAEALAKQKKTLGESIDEYEAHRLNVRGVKSQSASDEKRLLRSFLPVGWPLVSLTPTKADRLYTEYANRPNKHNGKPLSPNTHQWVLAIAKGWAKWCVKAGWLASNPFSQVEPIGRRNAGKLQHTLDEARRLDAYLVAQASAGDRAAVGVLMMLHLGLRQGEVSARIVRDVDGDGQVLMIPFGKTNSSRRRVRVPGWLQPLLRSLIKGKEPADRLFSVDGRPIVKGYWWFKVQKYCERAGVTKVCPHSLRGLHATLAIEEGATSEAVARALGHTSFAMTARHYASPDSVVNARVARASHLLAPASAAVQSDKDTIESVLAQLTPEQLERLRHRLSDTMPTSA